MHDEHELAACTVRVGGKPARQLAGRQGVHGLELLGEFAAQRHRPLAQGLRPAPPRGTRSGAAPRRAPASSARPPAPPAPATARRRAPAGSRRSGTPRCRHRRPRSAPRPRCSRPAAARTRWPAVRTAATSAAPGSLMPGVPASLTKATRSPRVKRSITAVAASRSLCSCTASSGLPSMPKLAQQRSAVARVLAGDRIDEAEHVQRTQAQVGEVADRGGHHVQCRGRVMLVARSSWRRLGAATGRWTCSRAVDKNGRRRRRSVTKARHARSPIS